MPVDSIATLLTPPCQPISDLFEVSSASSEGTDFGWQFRWLVGVWRCGIGWHGDPMDSGMDVDASGVGIDDRQGIGWGLATSHRNLWVEKGRSGSRAWECGMRAVS
ncbi:MAG: hypothetical protein K8U57_30940 [Planctomycetes bacterium]|nr:hypothetical protein [Planctomycetota bacterium]